MRSFWFRVGPNSKVCVCVCVCMLTYISHVRLCDPMDGFQARTLEWVAIPSPGNLPDPGIKPTSPVLAGRFFAAAPPGQQQMTWDTLGRRPDDYGDRRDMASRRGTKDYGQAPKARRGKEGAFPCSLEPSEGVWHPDTLISDSGLQGNKKISVSVVFVVLCYNNSGKLTH